MTLRYYIGYDPRDTLAFEVCAASCLSHASVPVEIVPLKDWELRAAEHYWRPVHLNDKGQRFDLRDGCPMSTDFSMLRFCIPMMTGYEDEWVLWSDPDMLWRTDIAALQAVGAAATGEAVFCVKHDHRPPETLKMTGDIQRHYRRKNWTSLMLLNPARCRGLTRYAVNNLTKDSLHAMTWVANEEIGALPEPWNWLAGWSDPKIDPKIVHFTRGTPDMLGHRDEPFAAEWWTVLEESGINLAAFPLLAR